MTRQPVRETPDGLFMLTLFSTLGDKSWRQCGKLFIGGIC